jgi:hypothetical protein
LRRRAGAPEVKPAAALGSRATATHIQAVASLIAGAFAEAAMAGAADSKLKSRDLTAAMDVLLKGLESPAARRRASLRSGTA